MNEKISYLAAALLAMCTLQACSEKTVTAPTPTPARGVAVAPLPAPPKPMLKSSSTVCDDRKIVIEASCLDLYGPRMLACTSQSIKVFEDGTGKLLGTKNFEPVKGDSAPAVIDEKIGEMTCVKAKTGEKFIVTNMSNGGNCEECEWHELYSWDGAYLGSDRDRKVKNAALKAALDAIDEEDVDNTLGSDEMDGFYAGPKTN